MTIAEALKRRIPRIRKPYWNSPNAYLRLPLLPKGVGVWAELYEDDVQKALGIDPGGQTVLVSQFSTEESDYIEYVGVVSEWEKSPKNYSKGYIEK
jgi:hypothetical protein